MICCRILPFCRFNYRRPHTLPSLLPDPTRLPPSPPRPSRHRIQREWPLTGPLPTASMLTYVIGDREQPINYPKNQDPACKRTSERCDLAGGETTGGRYLSTPSFSPSTPVSARSVSTGSSVLRPFVDLSGLDRTNGTAPCISTLNGRAVVKALAHLSSLSVGTWSIKSGHDDCRTRGRPRGSDDRRRRGCARRSPPPVGFASGCSRQRDDVKDTYNYQFKKRLPAHGSFPIALPCLILSYGLMLMVMGQGC